MTHFRRRIQVLRTLLALISVNCFGQGKKQPREISLPPPSFADVRYGPYIRNVFDLWLPKTRDLAPLIVYIHGGAFLRGDKNEVGVTSFRSYFGTVEEYLASGWAVASLNYRFTDTAPVPAAYLDCARAIQFLRHHATKWNIDYRRIASSGISAGAGISLWLAFHEDLADPTSHDPVGRESTRLTCVVALNGQSSYSPLFAEKIGIPRPNFEKHGFFLPFYGIVDSEIDTAKAHARYEEMSAINYLGPGDPPVLTMYTYANKDVTPATSLGLIVHHPLFGIALKREMDRIGIECVVQYKNASGDATVQQPATKPGQNPIRAIDFLRRHLANTTRP